MKYKIGDRVVVISKTTGCKAIESRAFGRAQARGYATIERVLRSMEIYLIGGDTFKEEDLIPYLHTNRDCIHFLKK